MNDKTTDVHPVAQRLDDEMLEALDEELELELDDDRLDAAVEHITERQPKETIDRDTSQRGYCSERSHIPCQFERMLAVRIILVKSRASITNESRLNCSITLLRVTIR